ncbi:MAG: hypothetical protein JWN16_2233 [Alphaproteobacteria bacterium]|nr:hypothetical protein [Alphaproteobacteria bacterium]
MRRVAVMAVLALVGGVAACSRPAPPVGKWEGGAETGGTIVAARVEIMPDGGVKVSAPDVTYVTANREQVNELRARLASDLANAWPDVKPRSFDFDGKTFRKPGGVAPQMVWDKDTNQMTLELYIGANPALPIPLRPVAGFHDNPYASG